MLRKSRKPVLDLFFGILLVLFGFLIEQCKPVAEKEKIPNGTPVDCTYSLPDLAKINQFILENPNEAKLFRIRSLILLDSGHYSEALSDARRALALNPGDLYNFVVVGKAHRALGQVDSALSACHTAEKAGFEDPDNYLVLGDLYFIVRQYKTSLEYLNKALKLAPYEPKIYFLKGLLFWEQKDTTKALSNWQTSIEQDAGFGDGYAKLAAYYMSVRQFSAAEQYLRSGLRLKPKDAFLHYNMGIFLNFKGYTDSASKAYESALNLDPNLNLAQANLGMIRFQQRKYDESKILLEKALPSDPKNSVLAYSLGICYQNTGELRKAETELNKVVKLDREFVKESEKALERIRKQISLKSKDSSSVFK